MADLIFPPSARISKQHWDHVANTAASRSPFTGAIRTLARAGDRWRVGISTDNGSHREAYSSRAALQSIRAALRGQANRIWLIDPGYAPRGSFPASELLTNGNFESGTTGWVTSGGGTASLSVNDRVMRVTRGVGGASSGNLSANAAVTAYSPYVARHHIRSGRGVSAGLAPTLYVDDGASGALSAQSAGEGYQAALLVPATSIARVSSYDSSTLALAGAYFDVAYASLSRCALVDNGINLLLQSDALQTTWTATRCSISADSQTAPNGTVLADRIVEDSSAATTHFVTQTGTVAAAVADFAFSVAMRVGSGRSWIMLQMMESTASHDCFAYFDISNGLTGSTGVGGANFINARSFISPLGGGWYQCTVVGRKVSAATSMTARIYIGEADLDVTFTGNGSSFISAWRATLAPSSVVPRLVQTTTTVNNGTLQTGSALEIKGLPPSTNGLLLHSDRVQIGTQLNMVTARLDSDGAGLGYLQCASPWRATPANDAPVIINNPMGRFVLTGNEGGWDDSPGGLSDFEFELEEALDA